jgi:hypothetical protein
MTNHTGRLYGLAVALVAFFLVWAVIAAHPWVSAKATRDPRLTVLTQREQRLRQEARLVQQVVGRRFSDYRKRFAAYKVRLAKRQTELAAARAAAARTVAAPSASYSSGVRVVTLPPLVITRTS